MVADFRANFLQRGGCSAAENDQILGGQDKSGRCASPSFLGRFVVFQRVGAALREVRKKSRDVPSAGNARIEASFLHIAGMVPRKPTAPNHTALHRQFISRSDYSSHAIHLRRPPSGRTACAVSRT